MASTDINGDPILILTVEEAVKVFQLLTELRITEHPLDDSEQALCDKVSKFLYGDK